MKSIINWTLGGFFRSFGRILCYLVIGAFISIILSKIGFKLPSWMSIDTIYAEELTSWTTQQARVELTHDGTDTWTNWSNINGNNSLVFDSTTLNYPVKSIAYHLRSSSGLNKENTYTFQFNYKPTPDSLHLNNFYFENSTTGTREEIVCTNSVSDSGFYWYTCTFSPQNSYSSSDYLYIKINFYQSYLTELRVGVRGYEERKGTNAVITEQTNNIINNDTLLNQQLIDNITNANNELINSITDSSQVCETIDKNNIEIDNVQLLNTGGTTTNNNTGVTGYIKIVNKTIKELYVNGNEGYLNRFCFYDINKTKLSCEDNAYVNEITIPQNAYYFRSTIVKASNKPSYQICQNGNQAIQDTLTDNDVSDDVNNANNFFHNFNLSLEGPVSQIVLLPINVLQYLIVDYNSSDVHPPLCTTLKGQQVCIPSGDLIWKRTGCHDNSPFGCPNFSQFKSFFKLVVGGYIYYKLLRRLVKAVEKGLDPQESGVNLMKL